MICDWQQFGGFEEFNRDMRSIFCVFLSTHLMAIKSNYVFSTFDKHKTYTAAIIICAALHVRRQNYCHHHHYHPSLPCRSSHGRRNMNARAFTSTYAHNLDVNILA